MTEQQINVAANLHRINSEYQGSAFDFTAGAEWANVELQSEKMDILAKIALLAERLDNGADCKEVAAEMRNIILERPEL